MKKLTKKFHKKYDIKKWITSSDTIIKKEIESLNMDLSIKEFREFLFNNYCGPEYVTKKSCNNKDKEGNCLGHKVCDCLIAIEPTEGGAEHYYKSEIEIVYVRQMQKTTVRFNYCPYCSKEIDWS